MQLVGTALSLAKLQPASTVPNIYSPTATNKQKWIAPLAALKKTHYAVMEHFYTLQGEGTHAGRPAYFIRLAGCDVGCVWCDVKESWDAEQHPVLTAAALAEAAQASGAPMAVLTGGEPTLHDLTALTSRLREAGLAVHIETSGTQALTGQLDWVTLSPKKFKPALPETYEAAHELKVIIASRHDLQWAEGQAECVGPNCRLLLQPEWDTPEAPQWIIGYIKQHPRWALSLQTHKYLSIP